MFNELKRDFIVFKNNFKLYLGNMLPRFGIVTLLYLISNISVLLIVKIARRNRYDGFEANAGMQTADDEFILNDFAQDIKYDEQINAQEADSKSQTEDSSL